MKNKLKKLISIVLCVAMLLSLAAVLGGCSKDSGTSDVPGSEGSTGSEVKPAEAPTIVFGLSKTWETLRPFDFINGTTFQVGSQIFDKLIYMDEESKLHPRGAESWEWSEDGMTLTFHLDPDATWHDGEKVTAEDYVFSYKLYATSEVQFQNRAGTKYLEGVDATTGIELEPDAAAAEAVDEYTLKLKMNSAYNQNSYTAAALNAMFVLPKHCFTNEDGTLMSDEAIYNSDFWNAPIGSGPCIYESEVTDSSITLKADADYHLGAPQFGTMIMQVIDTSTAIDKIISGDVDILGFNLTTEVAELYLDDDDVNIVKEANPSTQVNLCFNNKRVPQKIRQAVDCGINKQDILNKLYSGNGVVNNSAIFPTYPGYTAKDIYDPDRAAALVQSAIADGDWSADSKLVIGVVSTGGENAATLIKSQLEPIGIAVEIKQDEMATIQQAMITDLGDTEQFQYSCAIWSIGITYVPTKIMGIYALYADSLFMHNDTSAILPIFGGYMSVQQPEDELAIIQAFQNWELENVPQSTIVQYGAYSATAPGISNVDLFNNANYNQASWLWDIS